MAQENGASVKKDAAELPVKAKTAMFEKAAEEQRPPPISAGVGLPRSE
jgi:hypothetical protein